MSTGLGRTFIWNGENRPSTIVTGTATPAFAYAPGGERLTKSVTRAATDCSGTKTDDSLTLTPDIERGTRWTCANGQWSSATTWTKYPHADASIVGTGAGAAKRFLHRDHLATVGRVTDGTGTTAETDTYTPYGTRTPTVLVPGAAPEAKGFTGERDDPEAGLLYLHARYYDPKLGLFVSPESSPHAIWSTSSNR